MLRQIGALSSGTRGVKRNAKPAGDAGVALVAALLVASFLALALSAVSGQDPTLDERFYFGAGRSILLSGEWAGRGPLLHPPLGYYVSSLPLFFLPEGATPWDARALFLCRAASLVAFGVPLLAAVFLWARQLHGTHAALAALALMAFSPTLLAHAPLITPDLPLTATGFIALFLYTRWQTQGGGPWAWGAVLGLALLSKGSAWLFVAAILVLALRNSATIRPRYLAGGLAVAWLVLNLGYGFAGLLDFSGKAALVAKSPDAPLVRAAAWAAAPFFPLPYLQALATQLHVAVQGVPSFLMGEVSTRGFLHYFLVALTLKETLSFLALLALAAAGAARQDKKRPELALLLPAAAFFLAFSTGRVQIGIRYVLPSWPFLAVFAARLAASGSWRRRWQSALMAALLLGHVVSAMRAYPHYIAYFNELVGGPARGYRYLVDSNLDWGQDRSRAAAYAREHGYSFEPETLPRSGGLVVGATRLMLLDRERYRVLREEREPAAHVAYSFLVYDLDAAGRQ